MTSICHGPVTLKNLMLRERSRPQGPRVTWLVHRRCPQGPTEPECRSEVTGAVGWG